MLPTLNLSITSVGALGAIVYLAIRTIYRIYFHPLRRIPGPKLAAASHVLEFYYDIIKGGKYIFEVERMHKKYGPIVRINPRQVHISDPEFYDEIYTSAARPRDKDVYATARLGSPHFRRRILNNFFSKQSVLSLEPLIQEKVTKLADYFEQTFHAGTVVRLNHTLAAFTSDVIAHYCYGESYNYLDALAEPNHLKDGLGGLLLLVHVFYFFPFLPTVFASIPLWLTGMISPAMKALASFQIKIHQQSTEALAASAAQGTQKEKDSRAKTMFDALADPALPAKERTIERLTDEGVIVLGAGSETTANNMALCLYHLSENASVMRKLRDELKQVMPTPTSTPSWTELENLPYFNGVINEALRLAIGGSWRLPRIPTQEALCYKNHLIPQGTPVIISQYFMHMNPDVFPEPSKFDPERWIKAAANGDNLGKYLVPFHRGTRNCIGLNLAYAELYLGVATIARRFDLEVTDTTIDNVTLARDYGVPHSEKGAWDVKVRVRNVVKV
ncbi:cytochrome P450 [Aspergillus granulosus]|uniref:Cytochrome P450 n=1 Tax=Aspergillus granulosus TaxID=176169 RepID=A0ABR4HT21_9EURO